jgi:beta-lactamase class A
MHEACGESVKDLVGEAAAQAGADVFAHAVDIDSGDEIGVLCDAPVVAASVFKVPVLLEYVRQVDMGELAPDRRVTISAGSVTGGSTGLSVFSDDSVWSLRDVAASMITVSDNAATDIVTRMVGVDRVNATMVRLGLPGTVLEGDCAAIFATISAELGVDGDAEIERVTLLQPGRVPQLTACTPALTNRTTPREATSLLRMLWTDAAAGPDACSEARRIMGLQIWPHRLSSGFPDDAVKISGKTGTLLGVVRNEIGVVEFRDHRRYAVAVFARTRQVQYRHPAADKLIGTVGRLLVDHLASLRRDPGHVGSDGAP